MKRNIQYVALAALLVMLAAGASACRRADNSSDTYPLTSHSIGMPTGTGAMAPASGAAAAASDSQ